MNNFYRIQLLKNIKKKAKLSVSLSKQEAFNYLQHLLITFPNLMILKKVKNSFIIQLKSGLEKKDFLEVLSLK